MTMSEFGEAQHGYDLPLHTLPELELADHIADLWELQHFLRDRGIEPTGTRIERYTQYCEMLNTGSGADPRDIFKNVADGRFQAPHDWYLYVIREVHELMWILKGLKCHVPIGVDEKLRVIIGGQDFAALDKDSHSRNTQFELRVASYFCQAGCEVDVGSGTDVLATTDTDEFYVECKRIASPKQVRKRISRARKQLAERMPVKDGKRRVLGCIALDITKLGFTHNGLTWGVTPEHTKDIIQQAVVRVASEYDRHLEFEGYDKLLCFWLQIHIPALFMTPPGSITRFSSYHIIRGGLNSNEGSAVAQFHGALENVSVVDSRALPPKPLVARRSTTIPAGTVFHLDHDRFRALKRASQWTVSEAEEVIGSAQIDGDSYEFTFFELSTLPKDVVDVWANHEGSTEERGSLALGVLVHLLRQRSPYEVRPGPSEGCS